MRAIGRPLKLGGDPVALGKLRVLLASLCMRRSKQILKDKLPTKTVELNYLKLRNEERDAYDVLFDSARLAFKVFYELDSEGNEVMKRYSSFLECLLRLRQACNSVALVPPQRIQNARDVLREYGDHLTGEAVKPLTLEEAEELLEKLQKVLGTGDQSQAAEEEEAAAECCVCFDRMDGGGLRILQRCKHMVCMNCLDKICTMNSQPTCPMCRAKFTRNDIKSLADVEEVVQRAEEEAAADDAQTQAQDREDDPARPLLTKAKTILDGFDEVVTAPQAAGHAPTKIEALVASLKRHIRENPTQKVVVFSQVGVFPSSSPFSFPPREVTFR